MENNFADRLSKAIAERRSQLCVGLDPRVEALPEHLLERYRAGLGEGCGCRETGEMFEEFCTDIIEAVASEAVAVKPQLACFEQYGPPGIRAFKHVCRRAAEAGLLVIADAKRGDIGISARSYSAAYIGRPTGLDGEAGGYGADAVTVNPWFGGDGVEPFLDDCRRHGAGIFILVRTSNPGADELQGLKTVDGERVFEAAARLVSRWGEGLEGESGYSSVGAVVGATRPQDIPGLRRLMPHSIFLLPGCGAQGAGVDDVAPAFDRSGLGALVTASRSIIYAGSGEDYAAAAAEAAASIRKELWLSAGAS